MKYGGNSKVLWKTAAEYSHTSCQTLCFLFSIPPFFQVKFMKSKPGAAMVEMGDCYSVDRAITHLNNNFLFGQKLNVW